LQTCSTSTALTLTCKLFRRHGADEQMISMFKAFSPSEVAFVLGDNDPLL
jgi:hypothetical protein